MNCRPVSGKVSPHQRTRAGSHGMAGIHSYLRDLKPALGTLLDGQSLSSLLVFHILTPLCFCLSFLLKMESSFRIAKLTGSQTLTSNKKHRTNYASCWHWPMGTSRYSVGSDPPQRTGSCTLMVDAHGWAGANGPTKRNLLAFNRDDCPSWGPARGKEHTLTHQHTTAKLMFPMPRNHI